MLTTVYLMIGIIFIPGVGTREIVATDYAFTMMESCEHNITQEKREWATSIQIVHLKCEKFVKETP